MNGPDTPARSGGHDARAGETGGAHEVPPSGAVGGHPRDYRQGWTSAVERRAAPRPVPPPRHKRERWLYVLAMVALGAWAVDATSRAGGGAPTLPAEVLGVWRTNARSHSTRRFELRGRSLVFQVDSSESAVTTHTIARVRQVHTADGTAFSVDYFEDGAAGALLTFEFVLRAANPPEIIFPSQKRIVWTLVPNGKGVRR